MSRENGKAFCYRSDLVDCGLARFHWRAESDNHTHLRISCLLHNKAGDSIRWIIGQQFVLQLSVVFEKEFGF